MPYRFELAKSGRAGCQTKECKDEQQKIPKGELRVGTWVDSDNRQYWSWRHWGCLTPRMIENIRQYIAKDDDSNGSKLQFDLLDGWEELTGEVQAKITHVIEQGHVDNEDWKGDIECNRPGGTGMRLKGKAAKAKEAKEAENAEKSEKAHTSAAGKKRGMTEAESSATANQDEPATKKRGPGRPRKTTSVEGGAGEPKQSGRGKKAAVTDTTAESKPKRRGRPPKEAVEEKAADTDIDSAMPDVPGNNDAKNAVPVKRKAAPRTKAVDGNSSKYQASDNEDKEASGEKPKAKRGRKPASKPATEEPILEENDEVPVEKIVGKRTRKASANQSAETSAPEENEEAPAEKTKLKHGRKPAANRASEENGEALNEKASGKTSQDQPKSNGTKVVAENDAAEPVSAGAVNLVMDNAADATNKSPKHNTEDATENSVQQAIEGQEPDLRT